jgi:hypothetical protein
MWIGGMLLVMRELEGRANLDSFCCSTVGHSLYHYQVTGAY